MMLWRRYYRDMATGALISEEEYLRSSYKPNCEYIDGVLRQKAMGTRKHARLQIRLGTLLSTRFRAFEPASELTCRIRPGKYLLPDLALQKADHIQDPYPTEPVFLGIEILSAGDRLSETLAKCEDYLDWGVETTWIIDPEAGRAWEYRKGQRLSEVTAGGSLTAEPISIPLADLFTVL